MDLYIFNKILYLHWYLYEILLFEQFIWTVRCVLRLKVTREVRFLSVIRYTSLENPDSVTNSFIHYSFIHSFIHSHIHSQLQCYWLVVIGSLELPAVAPFSMNSHAPAIMNSAQWLTFLKLCVLVMFIHSGFYLKGLCVVLRRNSNSEL